MILSIKFVISIPTGLRFGEMSRRHEGTDFTSHRVYDWDLNNLLSLHHTKREKYSFVILNSPISNHQMVLPIWKNGE